jgi:hypothetical protein
MSKGGFVQNTVKLIIEVSFPIIAGFLVWFFFTKIYPLSDGTNDTYLYPYGAAILAGGVVYFLVLAVTGSDESGVERGEILLPEWKVRFSSWWQTRNDPLKFFWGGLYLPYSAGNVGLAAVGAPKSGKTVSIRLFLQSVLPHVGVVPDHRALIYDAKAEMMPILSGMRIDTHPQNGLVKILNPYDIRSYYWEMSKDINDTEIAPQLALLFVPVNTSKDEMWSDAAREVIGGVLEAFILGQKKWTLRDLLCATRTEERLKMVLGACDSTAGLIDEYLDKGRTTQGILIQLRSRLSRFRGIAALWDNMPEERGISLTDWLNNPNGSILLLGAAKEGTPLNAVNKLIIERIGQLIFERQTDCDSRRTWIVIDELRQCGKLDLSTIGNMGRGRGASLVIGYQDQSGLRDAYNENIAEELLGMCQHKAFFRLSSSVTAKWASEEFQDQDVKTSSGDIRTQPAVLPGEFTSNKHIPETNEQNGLTGYYKSLSIGAYKRRLKGKKLFNEMLEPKNEGIAGIERIDVNKYPFKDWTEADLQRLGYKDKIQLLLPAPEEEMSINPLEGLGRGKNRKGSYATPNKEELERSIQNGRWNA